MLKSTYVIGNVVRTNIDRYLINGEKFSWSQFGVDLLTVGLEVFAMKNAAKGLVEAENKYTIDMFHSADDPMYEVTGRAMDSNPEEVQNMINQLNEWGVSISYGTSTLGYGSVRRGVPGCMSVTENASYSAWCHEFQHAKDDMEAGWNAIEVLWTNPTERVRREANAYAIEIALANQASRNDIVKRLEDNLSNEIEKIWSMFE